MCLREGELLTHTGNKVVSTSATLSSCDLGAPCSGKLGSIGAAAAPDCARHVCCCLRARQVNDELAPRSVCGAYGSMPIRPQIKTVGVVAPSCLCRFSGGQEADERRRSVLRLAMDCWTGAKASLSRPGSQCTRRPLTLAAVHNRHTSL